MRRSIIMLAAASLAAAASAVPHPLVLVATDVRVVADAARPIGEINRNLTGVDWKLGTAGGVDELHPNLARADIAFQ
ncbi:MAG: hypothetical protein ACRDKS_03550, partial [Actinomycetota bacterium]